jgi:folate-binding protein YgfZ
MSELTSRTVMESPLATLHRETDATMGTWFGCALPDQWGDWLAEYQAARESVALIDKNYRGYLRFSGPDRVRYLNAILTNNIKDLALGHGIVSLFLNPQGRIQAEIETYAHADSLFCISYAMVRETLVPALDKFIIMDDVTLTDETDLYGTLALEGPKVAEIVQALSGIAIGTMRELEFQETTVGMISCGMTKRSAGGVAAAEFLALKDDMPRLWNALREATDGVGGRAMGYKALSALRLEQGIPWFGYDFGDKQIPHEAGLQNSHISYTKGCYTGQEIVERVRSRGQVNRVRALVKFGANEAPAAGAVLMADGREAGQVTRSAFSPALQTAIGMVYVRREKSEVGSMLDCAGMSATVIGPTWARNPETPGHR